MASSDVSSVTNHFPTANEGFATTLASTIGSGAATVGLNSTSGLTDGSVFIGIIEPGEAKEQTFTGTVDVGGSQITGVVWTRGTNVSHTAGVTIVDYVTGTGNNMFTKGIEVQHKQDGTHANTITTDTINENTAANGVTVDGLNIKDGKLNTNNSVVTPNVTDASITAAKLGLGLQSATVATSENTTSTSYTDLSTVGPTVTVTVPASGVILVLWTVRYANNTSNALCYCGPALSSGNTVAAADSSSILAGVQLANGIERNSGFHFYTGLTAASTVVTLKYKVGSQGAGSGTGTFQDRHLTVIPLGT